MMAQENGAADEDEERGVVITTEDDTDKSALHDRKVGQDQENSIKKFDQPRASLSEVFSFVKTTRVWAIIFGAFLSSVISGLCLPALAWYLAEIFEKLGADTSDPAFLKNVREVAYSFLILGVIALGSMSMQATLMETAAGEMTREFKKDWFRALLRQDMAYYDIKDVSAQATIISSHGNQYRRGIGKRLVAGNQFLITFFGGIAYGFYASWQTSLIVLACAPFMVASLMLLVRLNTSATARKNESYVKAGSIVTMAVSSIRTVLSLNAIQVVIDRYTAATEEAFLGAKSQSHLLGLGYGSQMASWLLAYIPVVLYGTYLLYSNVRDYGCDPSGGVPQNESCDPAGKDIFGALFGITIAASVLPQVSVSIEAITGARVACNVAMAAINRKAKDMQQKPTAEERQGPVRRGATFLPDYVIDSFSPKGLKPESLTGHIQFSDVTFAYPTRQESTVFDGLNLCIEPGRTLALVGPSGSGKSTAVQLLERFYDPDQGSIFLDGKDLRTLNVKWLRQQIGLVNQEPSLFPMSIRENIKVARPNATEEDMIEAAKKANAHSFIAQFADGYDTQAGDKGAQLSGGQKQRIVLARVILQKPSILLLDEATSALDSESEQVVQEALDKLMKHGGNTTLVIAHRLSTIKNCDSIAVVDDGRIVESGTHENLLSKRGKYFDLVQAQKGHATKDEVDRETDSCDNSATPASSRKSSFVDSDNYSADECVIAKSTPVLRFRDVHFSYPTRTQNWVFRGLDLSVRRGETLALVGESGGGKSTIIQLIEAFYHPNQGSVEFLGVDIRNVNVQWLRDQVGLVMQEPVMFDTTILENIRFGYPQATLTEIENAARQANIHDDIMNFPDGYETLMGEGGSQVSGGQKQRLALARALIKKPKILLLDEATSALDSASEQLVQEALDEVMANSTQTTIVIAHRLSSIRNASRIAVIGHGKVQELGTHNELMAKPNGRYRKLQSLQSLETVNKQSGKIKRVVGKVDGNAEEDTAKKQENLTDFEVDKDQAKTLASRIRLLGFEDWRYYLIGGIGAILAGCFFPAYGFVFADMLEVLYFPVQACNLTVDMCQEIWDDSADDMKNDSLKVFYQVMGLIALTLVGNILLFYGFGTASEMMNKRLRDLAFQSLIRQEVAWFDKQSEAEIVSKLARDTSLLHAFAGEPIRTFSLSVSSVLVGLVIAFVYMWPLALVTLGILPFMSFGAEMEMKMYMGEDEGDAEEAHKHTSSQIAIESIRNIRTIAALTLEEDKLTEFSEALEAEEPTPIRTNFLKGCGSGVGQFVQMWGMSLLFWFGGWMLANHGDKYSYREYLVSTFALFLSLYGLALAFEGMVDKDSARRAAVRVFELIDRQSLIDPLSAEGEKALSYDAASEHFMYC